ncbi:hypothetical protein [Mucilaginibacter sp.]|uniref:hypothetical protein n=1 Tax=Mucilaginibacter sp. TaxID=1882438 RepID=UPI00261A1B91|nr:hypothetical protein [Mucilaginibacter sp.]MDB4919841.1 hypothetical protein [Mucilaginibacter sp.]
MQDVAAWLLTKDYEAGVLLYAKYGTNSFLKQKFGNGPDEYNVKKLFEVLSALSPMSEKSESPKVAAVVAIPKNSNPDHAKKYLDLLKKKEKLYMELNILMGDKHHLPEGEELRICCTQILIKHQALRECWALVDHYQEHQSFPAEKPFKEIDPDTEIQYLRQTISKAKARIAGGKCRNVDQTQKLIDSSQSRLDLLLTERKTA